MRTTLKRYGFAALVIVLAVAAEVAAVYGTNEGSAAARYVLPLAWTLPLLLYRRAPEVAVLAVTGALALESYLDQPATESITALPAVVLAFWIAGTIDNEARSVAVGLVAFAFGVLVVAQNPGPFTASDAVFLAIAGGTPFAAGTVMRAREREARELDRRTAQLERERQQEARAAVAEERTRIARELHDVVGHSVTVMTIQAGAARMLVENDPGAAKARLLAVEESGREALAEMRRMLEVLRDGDAPEELDPQPGVDDLDQLVADTRAAGLDVELAVEGKPMPLSPGAGLAAYRIVQEALTNVRKHAAGARTRVRLRYATGALEVAVENDAASQPSSEADGDGGHGVIGMRERVALYGGELEVGPSADGGFAVHARLPLEVRAP
jgi:signal transduction histidine kinase